MGMADKVQRSGQQTVLEQLKALLIQDGRAHVSWSTTSCRNRGTAATPQP